MTNTLLAFAVAIFSHGDFNTRLGAQREAAIILQVAKDYELTAPQTRLLFCIRREENGRPGFEFGVHSGDLEHVSHRFKDDPEQSVELQARYAAGSITRRYTGDLDAFARRWCPYNWDSWAKNVRFYLEKF